MPKFKPFPKSREDALKATSNLLYFYEEVNEIPTKQVYVVDIENAIFCKLCKFPVIFIEYTTQAGRLQFQCHSTTKLAHSVTLGGIPAAALLVKYDPHNLLYFKGCLVPKHLTVYFLYYPNACEIKEGGVIHTPDSVFYAFKDPMSYVEFLKFLYRLQRTLHDRFLCFKLQHNEIPKDYPIVSFSSFKVGYLKVGGGAATMKRSRTTEVRKKLNNLAKDYLEGKLDLEAFIHAVLQEGKPVWDAIKLETQRRYGGYLTAEDIEATILEGVTIACMNCKNYSTFFAYARQTVKASIKRLASTLAFANVVVKKNEALEKVSLESLIQTEDEEGNHSPADIEDPLVDILVQDDRDAFTMIELRDFVEKMLNKKQQQIFYLLWEGASVHEIAQTLKIPKPTVEAEIEQIRTILSEFLS